eukprot:240126-Chlamydomonas_euryale.AAC.1
MKQAFKQPPPGLAVQGMLCCRSLISGQDINVVRPDNLRKMLPPPEPSSWHPRIAELYTPENLSCFCDPVLTLVVPRGHVPQLTLLMSNQSPAAATNPHPFTIRAPSIEGSGYRPSSEGSGYRPSTGGSGYRPSTPARTCHIVHAQSQA